MIEETEEPAGGPIDTKAGEAMADTEVLVKALKDLPNRIQTASLKERRSVIGNVRSVLSHPGITDKIIGGICRAIQTTLHRYRDGKSQSAVRELTVEMMKRHPQWTTKHMSAVVNEAASQQKHLSATYSTAQCALQVLSWSCAVGGGADASQVSQLAGSQAVLLASVAATGLERETNKAYGMLSRSWQATPSSEAAYLAQLRVRDGDWDWETVVLGAAMAGHLAQRGRASALDAEIRGRLLEAFIKTTVSSRTKPPATAVTACYPLLRLVTHDEFRAILLPALLKAMLRSPEVILECVGLVLAGLELDLSEHAGDLCKSVCSGLQSKDELARSESCEALGRLAVRCCDPGAIETSLRLTFEAFAGAGAVFEHKISVLRGVAKLSRNGVPASDARIPAAVAVVRLTKVLRAEVHEKTLCHALEALASWIPFCDPPDEIEDLLTKGLALKTSTSSVRTAYLRCASVLGADAGARLRQCLRPQLRKAVEKAAAQPTQIAEGLAAACLLVVDGDPIAEAYLQALLSDRFLATADDASVIRAVRLCESLLSSSSARRFFSLSVNRALVRCLTATGVSVEVRRECFELARRLTAERPSFAVYLLDELTLATDAADNLPPHAVVECLTMFCGAACASSADVLMRALKTAHRPSVMRVRPDLWWKLVKRAGFSPNDFVRDNSTALDDMLVGAYDADETRDAALAHCCALAGGGGGGGEQLVKRVANVVAGRAAVVAAATDDDYETYLTAEGELHDKTVVPADLELESAGSGSNVKRESKAYSFKEQQEELQLRKELEEKRRREGKERPHVAKYTVKQAEAIKTQLAKESAVRQRLAKARAGFEKAVRMMRVVLGVAPRQLSLHYGTLVPALLEAASSPLAVDLAAPLFVDAAPAAFGSTSIGAAADLGRLVGRTTVRLLPDRSPRFDLPSDWTDEPLETAVERAVVGLRDLDVVSSCAVSYALPLVRDCVRNGDLLTPCLRFLQTHVPREPPFLARDRVLDLLLELYDGGSSSGNATTTLDECLAAVAGDERRSFASSELHVCLQAVQHPNESVREAALVALALLLSSGTSNDLKRDDNDDLQLSRRTFVARHDSCERVRVAAERLGAAAATATFPRERYQLLLDDVQHDVACVQEAAARALGRLLDTAPLQDVDATALKLMQLYSSRLGPAPKRTDEFGRALPPQEDAWGARRGVALALAELAPLLSAEGCSRLVTFFVETALADRNEIVRRDMLAAAVAVVDSHGQDRYHRNKLLPVLERFMDKAPKSGSYDAVRQAVVVLTGSLARHLEPDDPRIRPVVQRLLGALSTPSQQVQEAVAGCLPPLVPAVRDDVPALVQKMLGQLLKSDKYGDRRGAAYGLAGLVKGTGILALKQLDIMTRLTEAIQDKKNYRHREGALFAFEMLCQTLGRLFEPYVVHVLPHLLLCFGDSSQYVRSAADDTARVVMSKLSAHGVKLVLPSLLAALEEDSWRTKTGSVELLGAMAYCAPKQLSSCLPSIVPKLIQVLSDSHVKVQDAGVEALRVIGSVIRNPEIQAIVPVLLKALQDPSRNTSACLQTLLDTQFVHFIDAPSLALIMPVVQRAFLDRSTETRKMAAQIIGNMYSLTDQKDLAPYLPTIIPGLKTSLLDPVPEVRGVSARALGAMVRGMGESSFEELLPWLMQTLTSETSSVDRSGAAQGLSEVVGGLGVEKLHRLMPEIIATAERADIAPHVKDGYIMMFIYMPAVFTDEFTRYIGRIIKPILKALADENEYVRDTALKAGQRIVNLYADSAIALLLPELERGLFDDNWRIRYSSVQLLGDLLYRISGVTGKMSTETASEDDNFGTEQSHAAIITALGADRRNRVLAGLYMGRSDVALMVRQSALHVWKVVVTNTPRTLREILPTLFGLLLGCLASESYDKRQVAARTLGDLVRKLGERVLPEIIPILERGLQSDRPDQRQGVCIGLSEIMASTSREMLLTFANSLVPTVRLALCDPLPEVRRAAAKTFDGLHSTVGVRALDDILPPMLDQLGSGDPDLAERTLDGLRQVMAVKSRVVLPYLVPQLTAPPVNTEALSILASVAGEALSKYLHRILPALLAALSAAHARPEYARQLDYCQAVVLSVSDEPGVRAIVDQLLEHARSDALDRRRPAAALLCAFCATARVDYSQHVPVLLRGLVHLCADPDRDRDVLAAAWEALAAVVRTLDPKRQAACVPDVRQALRYALADLRPEDGLLPGFCLPKGIAPVLPVFREAVLAGDADEKEAAAHGLTELIRATSASALQPSVVAITGPLIRILGDRFGANVKAAVLETLAVLLAKVGPMLKQFLPQLQTTFLKALNDPNRTVRLRAAQALSHLVPIHVRADPLFQELHSGVLNPSAADPATRETALQALRGVITPAADKMSEPLRRQIHATLVSMLNHPEDATRSAAAGCLGALLRWLPPDELDSTLRDHLLCPATAPATDDNHLLRHGRSAAVYVALKEAPTQLWPERSDALVRTLLAFLSDERVPVANNAVRACGYLLRHLLLLLDDPKLPQTLLVPFARSMNHPSNEVKQLLARVAAHLAKTVPRDRIAAAPELLRLLLPALVNGTKEKNGYVKANSEIALIAVLRLREGDDTQRRYLDLLDVGARESLSDVVVKVLRKVMSQPEGKEEDLDDTLIT